MLEKMSHILVGYFGFLPILLSSALVLLFTFFISNFLAKIIEYFLPKNMNDSLKYFIIKVFKVILYTLAAIIILNSLGLSSTSITAMVGISTLAIGTSLKDIFVNSVNGISMLIGGHIGIGDTVTICGFTGKIIKIDLIYTKIDCDGELVLIPNSKMFSEVITVRK